ncbi:hypothetical protein CEP51_012518 [Fusarium floridanum]|uniref:Uncharacterized protein n=1 Tax=Fusarium floridanum TaxID=1325733 RepID=A0A428QSM4_9HYPO|nr:hypothetical protein CEP51_012518 [Fusarium floridanum]
MTSVQTPLDLLDTLVTGVYMYNLISLWCEALNAVLRTAYNLEDTFSKCLDKDIDHFDRIRNQLMKTLDAWEEIPAWDEVWRLKLAFNRRSRIEVDPLVKLYTVAICKLLPSMVLQRTEHEDILNPPAQQRNASNDPTHLHSTPRWYQEEFEKYQSRQAKRESSRQRVQETILRYKALTGGALHEQDGGQQLPPFEAELAGRIRLPRACPIDWSKAIQKARIDDASSASKASSSTKGRLFGGAPNTLFGSASPLPPDSASSASKASQSTRAPVFGNLSSVFGSISPSPLDFASSASEAPSSTKWRLFGGAPNTLFGSASPSPPDSTSSVSSHNFAPTFESSGFASSASKAPSSAKAPLLTTQRESPFSAEQFKSRGNLGVTVSDSTESEAS